ncbi:MAG: hypothetical protein FRX48_03654 [Lasallia pustulata]|uniref:non-specific serine/threonine protein kinase n=1 Tax=Lasallia pustulata TaxID=136370 RepID=A0A5M8PUF8_9LECA|nr:MAG: hypothetical protein FRX48_03654 [Lasallia pustulata]
MREPNLPAKRLRPKATRPDIAYECLEDRYTRLKTLHGGAMNEGVYLVERKKDKALLVQKRIHASPDLVREIELLHGLSHPNIVTYVDAFVLENVQPMQAALYTEYCDLGNLQDLIRTYRQQNAQDPHRPPSRIPESFIWHTFLSLAYALQYIHFGLLPGDDPTPNSAEDWPLILHQDIKNGNIFLASQGPYELPRVVLGDFGLAMRRGDLDWDDDTSMRGTACWQAPELPAHSARGDVYSLGLVILSLCHLQRDGPIASGVPRGCRDLREWVRSSRARRGIEQYGVGGYSDELARAVRWCLRWDKENRIFAYELVEELEKAMAERTGEDETFPSWVFAGR